LHFTVVEADFSLSQARQNYDMKSTDARPPRIAPACSTAAPALGDQRAERELV
jgi:hypothetical protein